MSSLKDQLNQIAESNSTVALDRKKRQKLHSTSLIYNPKTASTQDLEFIYENAIIALDELIEIEPKLAIFKRTIFSESSILIDRDVQTEEEIKNLNNATTSFLLLISSKWHLTPTLHAVEWLVRRFQIHIKNAEIFLLSTINYYKSPVFKRILNIVKLPKMFAPLQNFTKNDKKPSNLTILKLFNNLNFIKLYMNSFLNKLIKHKLTYKNQVLFLTCTLINLLAINSNDNNGEVLNSLTPLFLEISAKLLDSNSPDNQVAAHTILAVLSSTLPLNKSIILAAAETILKNLDSHSNNEMVKKSALITLFKMFQTSKANDSVEHLPLKVYKLIDENLSFDFIMTLINSQTNLNLKNFSDKFLTSYIRSILRFDHSKLKLVVDLLKYDNYEVFEKRLIIIDCIHLSEILTEKTDLIEIFEFLISNATNEELVLKTLRNLNLEPEIFEIRLTTSLFNKSLENKNEAGDLAILADSNSTNISKALAKDKIIGKQIQIKPFKEFLDANSSFIFTNDSSLLAESDEAFSKLLSLFIDAVGKGYQSGLFLSSFFTNLQSKLTFLLRIVISPAAPTTLRLMALTNISKLINSIDKDSNLFTIVPCLIVGLNDFSQNVRSNIKKILIQISKRPSSNQYFLSEKIYGPNIKFPLLNPKDAENWLQYFLNNYLIEEFNFSHLLLPKKNESVFLLFWANQVSIIPLPYPKVILLNNIKETTSNNPKLKYSQVFEELISNYLTERPNWELRCQKNKTNFNDFEKSIVNLLSKNEKNDFLIDFAIKSLKSSFEDLANLVSEKIISIFSTLKPTIKIRLVKEILEDSIDADQSYDAVNVLQSIKLEPESFISILNENRILATTDLAAPFKRRRRSSSNVKEAFQKANVTKIAELHLKKVTIILEALDKSETDGSEALLNSLLTLLSDLETLEHDGGLPVLYAQETLASCMINCIHSLKQSNVTKLKSARADVLVSVIRNSPSTQVQNKFLLVIGELASLDAETILHTVMPIFTFMGAHSIRQDDEFTTQVVIKTIETVVPALLESHKSNIKDEIEFLLLSFTTALQHVPKHRRVNLFATLVKSLGASDSIAPFLFLIAQQYSNNIKTFKLGDAKNIIEFTKSFLSYFTVDDQLQGVCKYFELFKNLIISQKKAELKASLESRALFTNGILNFTSTELSALTQNGFNFINKIIEDNNTDYYNIRGNLKLRVYSILMDVKADHKLAENVKLVFSTLLESLLNFVNEANNLFSFELGMEQSDDSFSETESPKDSIKSTLFEILGNILSLLPIDDFTSSVLPLLNSIDSKDVRYHLTLVIGSKFDVEGEDSFESAKEAISTLLERISIEKDNSNIVQVSLNTISTLVSKFDGKFELSLLNYVLSTGIEGIHSENPEIIVSSLSVVTNCIQQLGVKVVASYAKIVPPTLNIFNKLESNKDTFLREQVQLAILLLFAAMIKKIPSFLQSNLFDIFKVIFYSVDVDTSIKMSIIALVVEHMDLKEVLKVQNKIWNSDVSRSEDSTVVSLFLSSLESTVQEIDKKSATIQSPIFFKLLISLFEYRSISTFDTNTVSRIESSVHKIVNAYVLKLNDKVFRPLFVILVRWAFDGEDVVNTGITEVQRLTAFFRFFYKLQDNLKGIITSYFTYLLEPVTELMKKFNKGTIVDMNLRRILLMSVTSSFIYDKDEYWKSTSRFELISEPLIDQMGNIENSIGKYLVKAVSGLASNNNNIEDHIKIMHKLLVNHMKATSSSSEKLWAVRTFKMIYSKVGESWLPLLPQLVPTIAELLEDDNEEVENEVRTGLVKVVENVLGEPFSRYLS